MGRQCSLKMWAQETKPRFLKLRS